MNDANNSFESPLLLDTLYQGISGEKWRELFDLAKSKEFQPKVAAMFSGDRINVSENRPVLHTALRNLKETPVWVDDHDIMLEIKQVWRQMEQFYNKFVGITDIIHIGIGGSDFGPNMVCDALWKPNSVGKSSIRVHFLSNIDSFNLARILEQTQPNSSLVIIVSKTFKTLETMQNAKSVMHWFKEQKITNHQLAKMLFAVTANPQEAIHFGIKQENIFPFWDWVGGRFSVWSAVGLPIALKFGFDTYKNLLKGAHAMDQHFYNAPLEENQPLTLALTLYHNQIKHGSKSQAIIPYAQSLHLFPAWLQQLEMESNGKTIGLNGLPVPFSAVSLFGTPGTNAQHSFFQLLHQGTDIVPVDFIAIKEPMSDLPCAIDHHRQLIANCLAQSQALALGYEHPSDPNLSYSGNRPNNLIILPKLDAYHLGALMALYEHRTFCLGLLYGVNAFDQPGVELGKKLAKPIEQALLNSHNEVEFNDFDPVTASRIQWFNESQQ